MLKLQNLHMQNETDQIQEIPQPPMPMWYETRAGRTFLGILIILLLLAVGFFALTGYYIWQIKFGIGAEKLAEEFNKEFTLDPAKANLVSTDEILENMEKYIYQNSPIKGDKNAPITVFAFIDFECPFSQENYPVFKKIIQKYAEEASLAKVIFKHLPVESIHNNALNAHLASACAQEQGKFWEYYDLVMTNKKLGYDDLIDYASQLKLDVKKFKSCLDFQKHQSNVDKDLADAATIGIRGTPTYFINGQKIEGVTSEEIFDKIILEKIQKK